MTKWHIGKGKWQLGKMGKWVRGGKVHWWAPNSSVWNKKMRDYKETMWYLRERVAFCRVKVTGWSFSM